MAYFGFRLDCPKLVSTPITYVFGYAKGYVVVGWLADLLAIVAVAIGLGGSISMGVFQIQEGIETWLKSRLD